MRTFAGTFLAAVLVAFNVPSAAAGEDARLTVAVFDFDIPGAVSQKEITIEDGDQIKKVTASSQVRTNLLTDKIITALTKSGRVRVVERARLDALLKESDLGEAGVTDPKHSIEAGKKLGANLLVFGKLDNIEADVTEKPVPYTDRINRTGQIDIRATIRLVDSTTGRVVSAQQATVGFQVKGLDKKGFKGEHLQLAMDELTSKLTRLVLDEVFPIKVLSFKDGRIYASQGQNNGVEVGTEFLVVRPGEELKDPDTGTSLGFEQTNVAVVKVVTSEPKMSIAQVVEWKTEKHEIQKGDICKKVSAAPGAATPVETPAPPQVDKVFK